jgi:hypothetical protein
VCGYAWLSHFVRSIDFATVINWLVDTQSLVFCTKDCWMFSWHWLQMLDVAHACPIVCMVFLHNEILVLVTMVFFWGQIIIELDDCRNYIHCMLMIVRLCKPEFAQHSRLQYDYIKAILY